MTRKGICKLVVIGAFALGACAAPTAPTGPATPAAQQGGGFDPSICNNIPVGIEAFEAMNPDSTQDKISCADVERCTDMMGWDSPPNVPCTGP